MAAPIQETPNLQNDTSAYELSMFSTVPGAKEFLNDPESQLQFLEPGDTVRAYVHNRGGYGISLSFDDDTFVAHNIVQGREYQLKITPDLPYDGYFSASVYNLQEPKVLADLNQEQILSDVGYDLFDNMQSAYVDGALYSEAFTAEASAPQFFEVSMPTTGVEFDQSGNIINSVTIGYNITLIDLSAGDNSSDAPLPDITPEKAENVALLYAAALDRRPDAEGLNYWLNNVAGGQNIEAIADSFISSDEFIELFGSGNNAEYIDRLYLNVLDRQPDQSGYDYWLNAMVQGQSRADVLVEFAESPENRESAVWLSELDYDPLNHDWLI